MSNPALTMIQLEEVQARIDADCAEIKMDLKTLLVEANINEETIMDEGEEYD